MILASSVGNGDYPFTWDGGNSIVSFKATSWNFGSGSANIQWIDEFGDKHYICGVTSDGTAGCNGPGGSYNLNISSGPTGVSVAIRKVPA